MKLTIQRERLLEACGLAEGALPGRAAGYALLSVQGDSCTLRATSPEVDLCLRLPVVAERSGQAVLPARTAQAILRATPADDLVLEACPKGLLLRGPGARFQLEAPSPAHIAAGESFPDGPVQQLDGPQLQHTIQATLFAAGPGSQRYHLDAVLWEWEANQLRLVATDNQRLAVAQLPLGAALHPSGSFLLPAGAVRLLARLLDRHEESVEVVFTSQRAFFRVGSSTLSIRYAAGTYPCWSRVIPQTPRFSLPLPVTPFLAAVRQATVLRERPGGRLLLVLEPGRLVLESGQAGAGCARVARLVPFEGGSVRVALNPRFLLELLRCLESETTILLGLTDSDSPVLFRAGDAYTHVLMPLRLE